MASARSTDRDAVVAWAERAKRVGSQAGWGGWLGGMAGWVGGGPGRVAGLVGWLVGSGGGQGQVAGRVIGGGWIFGVKNVLV